MPGNENSLRDDSSIVSFSDSPEKTFYSYSRSLKSSINPANPRDNRNLSSRASCSPPPSLPPPPPDRSLILHFCYPRRVPRLAAAGIFSPYCVTFAYVASFRLPCTKCLFIHDVQGRGRGVLASQGERGLTHISSDDLRRWRYTGGARPRLSFGHFTRI